MTMSYEILGGFLAFLFGWGGIFLCCVFAQKCLADQQRDGGGDGSRANTREEVVSPEARQEERGSVRWKIMPRKDEEAP